MRLHALTRTALPLLAALLLAPLGCEEGDDPFVPTEDPALALQAIAVEFQSQLHVQFNSVRTDLLGTSSNLSEVDIFSEEAEEQIALLVNGSYGRIWASGLLNESGLVAQAYPESEDSVLTANWFNRPGVQAVLADPAVSSGRTILLPDGRHSLPYYITVLNDPAPNTAAYARIDADSLVHLALTFIEIDTLNERGLFILEEDGRIIYDSAGDLFGESLLDTLRFPRATAALGSLMVAEPSDGSGTYDAALGPAALPGEEQRHVGWVMHPLVDGNYWILAVTAPVLEEEPLY